MPKSIEEIFGNEIASNIFKDMPVRKMKSKRQEENMKRSCLVLILLLVSLFMVNCGNHDTKKNSDKTSTDTGDFDINKINTMSMDQLSEEIKREGEVNVGNWTYTANDKFTGKFKEYIRNTYGVDIRINYTGSQDPGTYLVQIEKAVEKGNFSPYDVIAVEENYLYTAISKKLASEFLPSPLVPNLSNLSKQFVSLPYGVGFQSNATIAIIYNKEKVNFLTDWKDLADKRLKGKLTLPAIGDIASGSFIASLAKSLSLDIKNMGDAEKTIDFAVNSIGPNVLKYTTSSSEQQSLMRSGAVDVVVTWNSFSRFEIFEGYKNVAILLPKSGMVEINGYAWIPKKTKHPVLAQLFVNFEISKERQLPPDSWKFTKAEWMEFHEGMVGDYYKAFIPEWLKADYNNYYFSMENISKYYYKTDWSVLTRDMKHWMQMYEEKLRAKNN